MVGLAGVGQCGDGKVRGAVSAGRRRSTCRDRGGTGRTGLGRSAVWRSTRGSDREAVSVEGGVYCRLAMVLPRSAGGCRPG